MRRTRKTAITPLRSDVDTALAAMDAGELGDVVREMLLELDGRAHGRVVRAIIGRAARGGSGWAPAALKDADVAEAVAFAEAAKRVGHADPSDVDACLRRGTAAFLRKDYAAADRILGALLRPIAEGEIDLGQDEMIDEALGVDANECAVQYVVSAYMTSDPPRRAEAVRAAIDEVRGAGCFFEPIQELERAAVEPLPDLGHFLSQWRAIVAKEAAGDRCGDWDTETERWLREVVHRMEGSGGLAKVARSTKRAGDLRAWCGSLVEAGDWKAAHAAFGEAAELVADREYARGELLDGAALAAQELGKKDLSSWLERAWRAQPSMLRLRRWLGSARSRQAIRKRAAGALDACPKRAHRQRAFLHVLQGDWKQAAKLLAAAPGLGWSSGEHPGHLLFPLFQTLLGGNGASSPAIELPERGMDIEELEFLTSDRGGPRLATPEVGEIVRGAGIEGVPDASARKALLAAMRKAAEKRVAGVTGQKRRRYYGHAASLVAACVACDHSGETSLWAERLRQEHRRFPALRAEIDQLLGSS